MRILGLDLSLTSTGYCLTDDDAMAAFVARAFEVPLEMISDGRSHVVWHGSIGSKTLREAERLAMFADWIDAAVRPLPDRRPDHVAIEGYSYGSPFNATSLGELGGVVKLIVHQAGIPLHVIAPKTWRKVLCGNGNIQKHDVSKELHKRYGVEFASLDTAEAWAVATCLRRQLLGLDKPEPKARKRKPAGELLEAMS